MQYRSQPSAGRGITCWDALQPQRAQARMIVRAASRRPVILAVGSRDRQIVDAGNAHPHQARLVELPVFVAVRTIVLATVVVPFVRETHCDAVPVEGPHLLDEAVVQLPGPLASQERDNLAAPLEELRAVAPATVFRISQRDGFGIAGVPGVFSLPGLDGGCFSGEGWQWGT